jgi:hypothetical protein
MIAPVEGKVWVDRPCPCAWDETCVCCDGTGRLLTCDESQNIYSAYFAEVANI